MKDQTDGAVKERAKTEARRNRRQYKVVLLNDRLHDDGVRHRVLEHVFQKSRRERIVMMHVHVNGQRDRRRLSVEVAETKVETVRSLARHARFRARSGEEEA